MRATWPWRGVRLRPGRSDFLMANAGFRRLWAGQTISVFGSQITTLALPLAAIRMLHASTFQVGLLTAASYAAFLAIGLPVGAWADRLRRRPIMIAADAGRALTLASVPIAAAAGHLTIAQLYVVALLQGTGSVFFDVASMSYLPGLVGREHLVESNAKLQASQSLAVATGPSIGGVLIGLVTAPIAIAADAASYLASVLSLLAIRAGEPAPTRPAHRNLRTEITDGLRFVARHQTLRMIAAATATTNLFIAAFYALAIVFLVRQIGLPATMIGLLGSVAAAGGVAGALTATRLRARLGPERVIWISLTAAAPFALLIPLTTPGAGLACYGIGLFTVNYGGTVYNINQAAYRQLLCPPDILGRVNATVRFIVWGTIPLGAALGGILGSTLGNRSAIWIAAAGITLSPIWLLLSPLRTTQHINQPQPATQALSH